MPLAILYFDSNFAEMYVEGDRRISLTKGQ